MKLSLADIDEQIRQVENRIAIERVALDDAVNGCTDSLREMVTSPKTLLALLGVGFAVGRIMFKNNGSAAAAVAKPVGVMGLLTGLAGTALTLAQPRLGLASNLARWAANKYFSRNGNGAKRERR